MTLLPRLCPLKTVVSLTLLLAVRKIIGVEDRAVVFRIRRQISKPSLPGNITSSRKGFGLRRRASPMTEAPSRKLCTSNPPSGGCERLTRRYPLHPPPQRPRNVEQQNHQRSGYRDLNSFLRTTPLAQTSGCRGDATLSSTCCGHVSLVLSDDESRLAALVIWSMVDWRVLFILRKTIRRLQRE